MRKRLLASWQKLGPGTGLRVGKALALAAAVLVAVTTLWRVGLLQFLELKFYDHCVRQTERPREDTSPVVIVALREKDLSNPANGCWPISDQKLAELIAVIAAGGPHAIGLDLFRPVPVPCGGAESEALKGVLARHTNVVMAHNLPRSRQSGTPPPAYLTNRAEQLGVVNPFPAAEPNNVTRRVILYEDRNLYEGAERRYWSLGAQLALRYLAAEGITWEEVERAGQIWDLLGRLAQQPLEANDGGYVELERGGYQLLLTYAGPLRFPTYPLSDVFAGRVPPDAFRGKTVLVGIQAESVQDAMATPLSVLQPGVEVHAHTICQLITGAHTGRGSLRFLPEWQEAAALLAAVGLGLAVGAWASGVLPFLLGLTAGVVGIYFAGGWAFDHGYWIPVILPMAGFLPTAGLVQVFRFDEERKLRSHITGIFGQHVSPNVLEIILAEQGRLEPKAVTTTVFFADLKGFTTMANQRSPQEVVHWLNQFTEVMSQPVLRRNGMVIDFIGDAVLAGFGLPIPGAGEEAMRRDAVNAVGAALELGAAVCALNERMVAAGQPGTAVRIGLCTGSVVAGIVGSAERLKYTVIGATVNLAARLESVDLADRGMALPNGSFRLLVNEETWRLAGAQYEGTELSPPLSLKGIPAPVRVWHVLREKPQPRAL